MLNEWAIVCCIYVYDDWSPACLNLIEWPSHHPRIVIEFQLSNNQRKTASNNCLLQVKAVFLMSVGLHIYTLHTVQVTDQIQICSFPFAPYIYSAHTLSKPISPVEGDGSYLGRRRPSSQTDFDSVHWPIGRSKSWCMKSHEGNNGTLSICIGNG